MHSWLLSAFPGACLRFNKKTETVVVDHLLFDLNQVLHQVGRAHGLSAVPISKAFSVLPLFGPPPVAWRPQLPVFLSSLSLLLGSNGFLRTLLFLLSSTVPLLLLLLLIFLPFSLLARLPLCPRKTGEIDSILSSLFLPCATGARPHQTSELSLSFCSSLSLKGLSFVRTSPPYSRQIPGLTLTLVFRVFRSMSITAYIEWKKKKKNEGVACGFSRDAFSSRLVQASQLCSFASVFFSSSCSVRLLSRLRGRSLRRPARRHLLPFSRLLLHLSSLRDCLVLLVLFPHLPSNRRRSRDT